MEISMSPRNAQSSLPTTGSLVFTTVAVLVMISSNLLADIQLDQLLNQPARCLSKSVNIFVVINVSSRNSSTSLGMDSVRAIVCVHLPVDCSHSYFGGTRWLFLIGPPTEITVIILMQPHPS